MFKIDFTGDPTESRFWDVGDYEFTLVDAHKDTPPLHAAHGEWAVVVVVKFLPPCKLLWYHGPSSTTGYVVPGCYATWCKIDSASRLHEMQTAIAAERSGFGYIHPVSKIASFVVKGVGSVRMRALKVVQVRCARIHAHVSETPLL